MKKGIHTILTIIILIISFFICLLFQDVFNVEEHITTVFVFAVFLISFITSRYIFGILSSVIAVLSVNYAFTFPYFSFNFETPVNILSALVMMIISILTCAITTNIKHQEQIKAESEKERNRANLLRAISHDLRTPLTTIYGSTTSLLENSMNFSDEQIEKILSGIKEDSEWLIRMVENILSITKINTSQVKITKTSIVLDELIDALLLKFNNRYSKDFLEVILPSELIIIPMDPILIEQVLLNLLQNAIQHAKNMTKICLKIETKEDRVFFSVIDDGCGISEDRINDIFSSNFVSNNNVADSNKKNIGIGLSVCSTIINAHGGKMIVKNNSDKGCCFTFDLERECDNDVE